MRVLVLEDERPALEQLLAALHAWDPSAEVVAVLDAVGDAVRWLHTHPEPALILADIRLTDGDSLDLFDRVRVRCPVVFVTAYDAFTQEALEAGGIDYVLKPVQPDRLARALDKVLRLEAHFSARTRPARERLLVRRGSEVLAVPVADVAWFCTEHRLVFAVCRDGRRHVVDKTLGVLEGELDPERFFRINRSWLVAVDAVRRLRPAGKGRIELTLAPGDETALVRAADAPAFRAWLDR